MYIRGIRGATTVEEDHPNHVLDETRKLVRQICQMNPSLDPADIASIIFTVTDDISSEYPAKAVREMGWDQVPLLCSREIPVPHGLKKCIRVLILWNTKLEQHEITHVYLNKASTLRPDLIESTTKESEP